MRIRLVVATVVVTVGVLGMSALHASASGPLSLSAPASAVLGSGAPGTTIAAAIGPVTVTDDRALLSASWTVTVAETDFANGAQTIPATDASYAPGTITTTGVITVIPTSVTLANSAQTVVTGTDGVGDNTATWDPTVAVTVPATAAAGTYTGTLTQAITGTTSTASVTVTFTVTSGALTLSVPVAANLGSGAPGTTISAPIGPVTVTDDRALLAASWTVTVAETDFANGAQTIPATDASYAPGTITTTGVITVIPTSVTLANSAQTVVTGTDGVGDNTATWDPTVAVTVPATAAAGTYTGTLTHSIDPSVTITFTVVPATPSITTSQQPATAAVGSSIADQATVTGDNPTGTVTFNLYNNPNGTGTPLFTDTENLVGGVATSAGYSPTATGTVYWVATYNGDSNNNPVTNGLADEPVTVTPAAATHFTVSAPASVTVGTSFSVTVGALGAFNNVATTYRGTVHFTTTDPGSDVVLPADYTFTAGDNGTHTFSGVALATAGSQTVTATDTTTSSVNGTSGTITVSPATPSITTSPQPATATAGSSIADQATVTGDNPTGTVTFNLYNNPNGTGTSLFTDTDNLVGGVATSAGYTPSATGTVYWVATYDGDSNNNPVTSGPALEPVVVTAVIVPPSIAKAFDPASVQIDGTSMLTFTISNPNGGTALTGVAFTDTLPSGLVVSTPNGLTDSCGGTANAAAGGATISLTGTSVAASATCTVVVNVTGNSAGTFTNTSGAVSSANGGTGNTATGVLTVAAPVPPGPGPTTTTTTAPAPLAPFPRADGSYPNGGIVTFAGAHYVFAGGRAFAASANQLAAVQKVDPAQVLAAPAGASAPTAVAPRSGVTVSTREVDGNATIYVVGTDGELHPFATPGQYLHDGYDPAMVITVPNLGGLTVGSNAAAGLTALATRADGAIVNSSGTFFTFAGGKAFGIPTPAALMQVRKTNSAAELQGSVTSADTGAPIANGVVLSVAGPVYISYSGDLYPFKTMAQLANSGYGGTPAVPAPHTGGLTIVVPYSGS
jgi:hypothetical protein